MSSILAMKFVSEILLLLHHLTAAQKSTVLWTKFLFLLPSPSTATSTRRCKIWTGILFLSQLMGGASGSSVFVLPSTELWTGSRVEVGCYTDLGKQIIWARQPLGGVEEELVAHQETLLLAEDPRITVFVQQLGDRQVSKVTISEAIPADSGKYSCISMGGENAEEERTEVMVAVFDEINNDLTPQNMSSDTGDWNGTIVMEGTRGPRLDATTSLRSNAIPARFSTHLTNLLLAILTHTNC